MEPESINDMIEELVAQGLLTPRNGGMDYAVSPRMAEVLPEFWNHYVVELQAGIERLWLKGFLDVEFSSEGINKVFLTEKGLDYNAVIAELEPRDVYLLAHVINNISAALDE